MKKRFSMAIIALSMSAPLLLYAAPTDKPVSQSDLSTNVIGSQEAPSVLNVVPWKEQKITLEAKKPSTRLLDQVLQPLDGDVLNREIEYYNLLNQKETSDDMFLDD